MSRGPKHTRDNGEPIGIYRYVDIRAKNGGVSSHSLHYYGGTFMLGRVLHGICFGFTSENLILRVSGTALTLFPILGLSAILLTRYFGS